MIESAQLAREAAELEAAELRAEARQLAAAEHRGAELRRRRLRARELLDGCLELYAGNWAGRQAELPPHDFGAEAVVLSAVLWGDCRPSQVRIRGGWLHDGDHRCIWAVLEAVEELGVAGMVAWGGCSVQLQGGERRVLTTCQALGWGPDPELVARALAAGAGHGPLWYWRARLWRIMGLGGNLERCTRIIRDRARERALLERLDELGAALRRGERPGWRLVHRVLAGLLRMRQAHRWEELDQVHNV